MVTSYNDLREFLNQHIHEILAKLGRRFDSDLFIESFHRVFPNEYAQAVQFAGTYGKLHAWIARWYLLHCEYVHNAGLNPKLIKTINGNVSRNHCWEKC